MSGAEHKYWHLCPERDNRAPRPLHSLVAGVDSRDTKTNDRTLDFSNQTNMVLPRFVHQLATIGYDNSDSSIVPRRKAILWTDMRSLPQLPTGTLLSPAILNMREGHIGGSSSQHHKLMTCKRKE
jgi:hypothetical protein